jgi:hypothetical protein
MAIYDYAFYVHLVYFMAMGYILWPFGVFYGHLVYFMAIWYILHALVHCAPKVSGSPVSLFRITAH